MILLLNRQIERLEAMVTDKEKIIRLQEEKSKENGRRLVVKKVPAY